MSTPIAICRGVAPSEERQDSGDHVDEQSADHGSEEAASAPEQAGTAEHGRGDAGQRVGDAVVGVADLGVGGHEVRADRGGERRR